jgi:hypothetical protein
MDTKPQTAVQRDRDNRNRQLVIDYVSLHRDEIFEESDITEATEVPKLSVRRLLDGVPGIDQELLNVGKPDGKVCWRGLV